MSKLSYLARVLASLILHSYQNYAFCFASRFPLFHSEPMEWNKEHDVLFLREMLARNISGAKERSPARELAREAIVDSLNEIYSPKFQLKDKKAVRERWNLLRKKVCKQMSDEEKASGISVEELYTEKSITGNIPLDLKSKTPGRKTRTSDYNINKLWHFINASLLAMEHSVREYLRHLQGRKVCLFNAKFGFAVS